MTTLAATGREARFPDSIESRSSWGMAAVTVAILSVSYGSSFVVIVGLEPIGAALHVDRSAIALASSLAWFGMGLGGIPMGWVADRIGVRATVTFGGLMIASGLALSATGKLWAVYVGQGVLLGFLGNGAVYPPLLIYVSRWFDRRRGAAIALISSGQYVAGMLWPSAFEFGISHYGWQATMTGFGVLTVAVIVPVALLLRPPPQPLPLRTAPAVRRRRARVFGLPANLVQALFCIAEFFCCVPMAVPSAHLVAFCSDIGIPAAQGAAMLSVLLGAAFLSRQFWGWLADRVGGLRTILFGSALQALAISAFLSTKNEAGLFAVSAAFGLGFSGIIPAYVVAIREYFPSREASWRLPTLMLFGTSGMAFGSWFAGALYDHFGYYAPAFAAGAGFNLLNLLVIGFLLLRSRQASDLQPAAAR